MTTTTHDYRTLEEIKDALHASLDTYRDSEILGGITVAVTDAGGAVYSITTDGMSVSEAVEAIDCAQQKWDLVETLTLSGHYHGDDLQQALESLATR